MKDAFARAQEDDELSSALPRAAKAGVVDTLRDSTFMADVKGAVAPLVSETAADPEFRSAVADAVKATVTDVVGDGAFVADLKASVGDLVKAEILGTLRDEPFMAAVKNPREREPPPHLLAVV